MGKKAKPMLRKDYCWKHFGASFMCLPRAPRMSIHHKISHGWNLRQCLSHWNSVDLILFFNFIVHPGACELNIKRALSGMYCLSFAYVWKSCPFPKSLPAHSLWGYIASHWFNDFIGVGGWFHDAISKVVGVCYRNRVKRYARPSLGPMTFVRPRVVFP